MQVGIKFPSLHFGGSWAKLLYSGKPDSATVQVPKGQFASLAPPSLGCEFALAHEGHLEFSGGGKWKIRLSPLGISLPDAQLLKAGNFAALRSPEGEIGFSFDKDSSKHFFTIGQPFAAPKFSLQLKVIK